MPKKIALVTLDYPPEVGGVSSYLGNLVAASNGAMDVFVNEKHETGGPGNVRAAHFFARQWPVWRPMIWFFRQLKKQGYDIALVSHVLPVGTAAWIAKKIGGVPYIILLHGLDLRLALSRDRKMVWTRRILRGADLVLTNSAFVAREVVAFEPLIAPTVMYPAVALGHLPDRAAARAQEGVAEEDCIILCISRLISRKGIDRLIAALKTMPPHVKLVVVGDGPEAWRLKQWAAPYDHRVRFVSHATDDMRNRWYAAADIFALPAREEGDDVEGFGIVCLEAAMAGLPVIVGASGGASETIVDEETGLLVDPRNQDSINQALKRLVENPELRQKLGEAGRIRAQRDFKWEDRWKLLESLL